MKGGAREKAPRGPCAVWLMWPRQAAPLPGLGGTEVGPAQARALGGAEGTWGARRRPGPAKPQVFYETLPVVETFLRDRLPRLLPWCLLSLRLPASLSALSLRLWPALISLCLCLSLQPCLGLLTR